MDGTFFFEQKRTIVEFLILIKDVDEKNHTVGINKLFLKISPSLLETEIFRLFMT